MQSKSLRSLTKTGWIYPKQIRLEVWRIPCFGSLQNGQRHLPRSVQRRWDVWIRKNGKNCWKIDKHLYENTVFNSQVWDDGKIAECFWEKNKKVGQGREIFSSGILKSLIYQGHTTSDNTPTTKCMGKENTSTNTAGSTWGCGVMVCNMVSLINQKLILTRQRKICQSKRRYVQRRVRVRLLEEWNIHLERWPDVWRVLWKQQTTRRGILHDSWSHKKGSLSERRFCQVLGLIFRVYCE